MAYLTCWAAGPVCLCRALTCSGSPCNPSATRHSQAPSHQDLDTTAAAAAGAFTTEQSAQPQAKTPSLLHRHWSSEGTAASKEAYYLRQYTRSGQVSSQLTVRAKGAVAPQHECLWCSSCL